MGKSPNPRVRRNLRYSRHVDEGRAYYVVKDPVSLKYFRFGEAEAWLMQRMDGSTSLEDIAAEVQAQLGVRASAASLETFVARLKELGLAERTAAEKSIMLMEVLRSERKLRLEGNGNTLFRMRFSFGDPDQLFDRVIDRIRFFFTPWFLAASGALFAGYAVLLMTHWSAFTAGVAAMYTPEQYTLGFIVTLYATAVVVFAIHELGHGLTCKHFGGEVHEIGGMLLYFTPAFFCNVNDAWTFEKRSHRLWVTFAGGWIELVIGALGAFVWVLTEPGTTVNQIAFLVALIGAGLGLLLNFNPLIPLDGYYALLDMVNIPNLRARSFGYLSAWLQRHVLRLGTALPPATLRERKTFLIYGSLATVYVALLLSVIGFWAASLVVGKLGAWGWAILALAALLFVRRPARRLARHATEWVAGGSWRKLPGKRTAIFGSLAAVLLAAALLAPWTVRARGVAVVEPTQRIWLRPADGGWVAAVLVAEGQVVAAGDPVLRLTSPELELEHARIRGRIAAMERELALSGTMMDGERIRLLELALAAALEDLDDIDSRRSRLVLRAPFAAVVATPRPDELAGAYAAPGDSLIELWEDGDLRARVRIAQRDAGGLEPGAAVGLKFPVRVGWTWRSRIQEVGSAAQDGFVELLAPVGAMDAGPLRPGMAGTARVAVARSSPAGAAWYWLRRTVRTDWLL